MPVPSVADFIDAVQRWHLLDLAQLDELGRIKSAYPESRSLAVELIRRGWLTKYQANQLTQGRGKTLLLGSYVLLERLGEGGMGEVFKARNWKLGKIVALKLIRKERIDNPDAVRRFQREIRAAAQLDHAHIVRALDADEVAGAHLLVMEYVQGIDLAKLVKKGGPLPIDKACDYMRQAALGLQHACERGMVHRDIKPPNLLATPAGVVKILDMGLARLDRKADDESATMTREGTVMGTLDYISPEQAMDSHDVDIRADLYSLGCTLYFLLTGKVPFPGGEALQKLLKHRLEEPIPVERLRPDIPAGVAAVVRKLMAKQPEGRYQTPAEAAAALASALDHESQTAELAASLSAMQAITGAVGSKGDGTVGWSSVVAARSAESSPPPRRPRPPLRIQPALLAGAAIGAIVLGLGLVGLFRFLPRAPRPALPEPPTTRPVAAVRQEIPQTSALPALEQVASVAAALKRLNPGFDGAVKPTIEDGVVTGLEFLTDNVTDVSPVRAFPKLKTLRCDAETFGKGRLSDLSPLRDMALSHLYCNNNQLSDLSPLQGMPLTDLSCNGNQISDLRPLAGMELTYLVCGGNPITDIAPLKGLPLKKLWCHYTKVSDLAPLKGMPLTDLFFIHTRVSDLTPLKGMKIERLFCNSTPVSDLAPLRGMPLKQLGCDFDPKRDAEIMRSIKTLQQVNGKPAADFWKDVDKQQGAFEAWTKEVAALSADKQVEAVAAKLREINFGFDGVVKPTVEKGVVTGLEFTPDNVTDISPVRALPMLKTLRCDAETFGKGRLSDLSPLKGMHLSQLYCNFNRVSDLSPLRGMPLKDLNCNGNQVSDFDPLAGAELTFLDCGGNPITDLSPLRGMPLETLFCHFTGVTDLAALQGMPLTYLLCVHTRVSDLTPLKDMKLVRFYCNNTPVSDLSPLRGMPLKQLGCDFDPKRDADILRSLKTLQGINGKPVADFWKAVGDAAPQP